MEFTILKGDITKVYADAVVLPANEKLLKGSGVSEKLFKLAGEKKLKAACREYGHCDVGMSVPTLGFDSDWKYIIHSVVPQWMGGNHQEYELLSSAYLSALTTADLIECESIVFPLLASGNNGYDIELAYQIARDSIRAFRPTNKLSDVILVLYGERTTQKVINCGGVVVVDKEDLQKYSSNSVIVKDKNFADLLQRGANVAKDMAYDAIDMALQFLEDENNRKKLIQIGAAIAVAVIRQQNKNEPEIYEIVDDKEIF